MNGPAPLELLIWEMAEHFGWTLEYIGSLDLAQLHDWLQIIDGRNKAHNSLLKKGGET